MRTFLTAVSLFGLLWAGAVGAADATAQARSHFQKGTRLYKQAQYREAIAEFEAAYQARPHGVILYNLAQCYEKLGDLPAALRNYQEYLREVPEAQDRSTVESVITNLQRRITESGLQHLQVQSEPPGAIVTVDGKPRGLTPYSGEHPLGPHEVVVSLQDFEPVTRQVVLTPDLAVQLDLTLARKAPPPALPEAVAAAIPRSPRPGSTPPPPPPSPGPRLWPWFAAGAGAALLGALTLGSVAQSSAHTLTSRQHDQAKAEELYRTAQSASLGANTLYTVTGLAAIAGGALFVVERRF